jgi:hypothetical protein
MNSRQLVRFVVLAVEPVVAAVRASAKRRGADRKMHMAECVVARERDFGTNDTQFSCLTHLGAILREGDVVMGYDLTSAAWALEQGAAAGLRTELPDILLVRKVRIQLNSFQRHLLCALCLLDYTSPALLFRAVLREPR